MIYTGEVIQLHLWLKNQLSVKTSVHIYRTVRRHILQDGRLNRHISENIKPQKLIYGYYLVKWLNAAWKSNAFVLETRPEKKNRMKTQ